MKGIKYCWTRTLAGTGMCPICRCAKKPWHVPANYPLIKELYLELVTGLPSMAPPAPTTATPAPAPTPSPAGNSASDT